MTLFGWDASDFDWARGPMDLVAAKADGITWFTHKATEATNVKHIHLAGALDRARDAGIEFLGAYHVVRSSPSVPAQVNYFLGYLDAVVPWWRAFPGFMLQVDLELWSYDQVSAATGAAFAAALQAAQPKRVLTYASRGMYGDSLTGLDTPLWNANYGKGDPAGHYVDVYPGDQGAGWAAYSGQTPVMWQYGSRCTIGSQPGCDANAFRGTLADLRELITGDANPSTSLPGWPVRRKAPDMIGIRDPEGGEFTIAMDSLSPTGYVYTPVVSADRSIALQVGGVVMVDNGTRPGAFGPSGTEVRDRLVADVVAAVVARLPVGGGDGAGLTAEQVAVAVRTELDRTKLGRA
jgi:GH25 family lysozyme M1 (1,4-beta-N-acetylmuramidase)